MRCKLCLTPTVAQEAVALLSQDHFVQIVGTGHSTHRDGYDATMQAVKAFLRN